MKDKKETVRVNATTREVACGKILCAFLGGDASHRFALSARGNRGAAS